MTVEQIEIEARAVAQKYEVAAAIRKLLDDAVGDIDTILSNEDVEQAILEIVQEA